MSISSKLAEFGQLKYLEEQKAANGKIAVGQIQKLAINITSRCNEKCIYCYFSQQGIHQKGRDIDEDLFYRVTKEAIELGVTEVGLYTGGEPFLNENLPQYISWCKKNGASYVYLSTNGILCTSGKLEQIVAAGVDSLKFSIGGGSRLSFRQHHGVDAFDLVKDNIMSAAAYKKSNHLSFGLYLYFIVTKQNMDEVGLVKSTFKDYVDEIIFANCVNPTIPLIGVNEYLTPIKDAILVTGEKKLPCAELFNRIVVDETGWLCTCCISGPCLRVADLHTISLWDALNSEEMCNIRRRHLNNEVDGTLCKICVEKKFDEKNMHAFNQFFEEAAKQEHPIDIRDEIRKRFAIDE